MVSPQQIRIPTTSHFHNGWQQYCYWHHAQFHQMTKKFATPMKTDNSTANGIMNGTIKQQKRKAIDMQFYWLKDRRAVKGQFEISWAAGDENWADCFTKHHSATHHKTLRPCYLKEQDSPADLQGCLGRLKRALGKSSGPDPVP